MKIALKSRIPFLNTYQMAPVLIGLILFSSEPSFAEKADSPPLFVTNPQEALQAEGFCSDCNSNKSLIGSYEIIKFGQDLTYSCGKSEDYIGQAIAKSKSAIVQKLASQPLQQVMIKPTCTKQAMDKIILPSESFRGSCVSGNAGNKAPCVSQNYHQLMHNSLDLVSRCAKNYFEQEAPENKGQYNQVLQEILGKLTLESNLHLNAVSPSGFSGVGQLGWGSVEDVNRSMNAKDSMYNYLRNHDDKACQELAPILAKKMNPRAGPCEKMSLDRNHPISNLLYTFNYRMIQRKQLLSLFNSKVVQSRFDGDEKEKIFNLFMQKINTWAYNSGAGGIRWRARTALLKMPMGSIRNQMDLANLFEKIFTQFTGKTDPQICHGKTIQSVPNMENGCYLIRLKKKSNELSESVGGLSCINSQ